MGSESNAEEKKGMKEGNDGGWVIFAKDAQKGGNTLFNKFSGLKTALFKQTGILFHSHFFLNPQLDCGFLVGRLEGDGIGAEAFVATEFLKEE